MDVLMPVGLLECTVCRETYSTQGEGCSLCGAVLNQIALMNEWQCELCSTVYESHLSDCPTCGCVVAQTVEREFIRPEPEAPHLIEELFANAACEHVHDRKVITLVTQDELAELKAHLDEYGSGFDIKHASIGELFDAGIGFRWHCSEEEELISSGLAKRYAYPAIIPTPEESLALAGAFPRPMLLSGHDNEYDRELEEDARRMKWMTEVVMGETRITLVNGEMKKVSGERYPESNKRHMRAERETRFDVSLPWRFAKGAVLIEGRLDIWRASFSEHWHRRREMWVENQTAFSIQLTSDKAGLAFIPLHRIDPNFPVCKILNHSQKGEPWELCIEVYPASKMPEVFLTSRIFNAPLSGTNGDRKVEEYKPPGARPKIVGIRIPPGTPKETISMLVTMLRENRCHSLAQEVSDFHTSDRRRKLEVGEIRRAKTVSLAF